jgi:cyclic pyranopterin phosphate synthase
MGELTHVDGEGRARMVDVGGKPEVRRRAVAAGRIDLAPETLARIRANEMKKGDVLTVAQIAGIQAAKRCADWIPLCHPLPLTDVDVRLALDDAGVAVTGEAACTGRTGVEMEALTAVSAALLTVYDMCKAVDKAMVIGAIRLLEKTKEDA